ncbi:MAG: SAM-dependent methyltransferase, partial [Gammaproteobacteria bacterium]
MQSPCANDQARSEKLQRQIHTTIAAAGGGIPFAQFMQHALYTPDLGYYCSTSEKFGASGDFITAPEVSPLFAQCLAKQCQQILADIPDGELLEIGPGSGRMAAELLIALEKSNALPQHYYLLEISAELQHRQYET